jgi:hypothetical protein
VIGGGIPPQNPVGPYQEPISGQGEAQPYAAHYAAFELEQKQV